MDSKRRKNRRKNKNNPNNEPEAVDQRPLVPSMMPPMPDASMGPGMGPMDPNFGVPTQWGTSMGAVNDEESKEVIRNRQYGYAIMACAVVVLAVLMVITAITRWITILSLSCAFLPCGKIVVYCAAFSH